MDYYYYYSLVCKIARVQVILDDISVDCVLAYARELSSDSEIHSVSISTPLNNSILLFF